MSFILQKGIIPDRQDNIYHPLTGKDHVNIPANIENLITGPCRVYWASRNVQGHEGHRNISECATFTEEIKWQETALGLTLDTLFFFLVKPKKSIDVVTVLNIERDLGVKVEKKQMMSKMKM